MSIRLYTFYTDLLADPATAGQAQAEQTKRDQDLFQKMHVEYEVPFFPHTVLTFNNSKHVFESISHSTPLLCFAFVTGKSCMVLNNRAYYKFNSLQHAQETFYQISGDDVVLNLLNKYKL